MMLLTRLKNSLEAPLHLSAPEAMAAATCGHYMPVQAEETEKCVIS